MSIAPIQPARRLQAAPRTTRDHALVQVELARPRGGTRSLGDGAEALASGRLTPAERRAVRAMVTAVRLLRTRTGYAGLDDAGSAVRLVLRDPDASTNGPWATKGHVVIGSRNALAGQGGADARDGVLLTVDVALHELVHAVQFEHLPRSARQLHAAIGEGLADAAAMLATGDRSIGEGYFAALPDGRPSGSVRTLEPGAGGGRPLGDYETDLRAVQPGTREVHAAGGVVVRTFDLLAAGVGRRVAERLLWAVVRDRQAWQRGGSWSDLAASVERQGRILLGNDAGALASLRAALAATGLR